MLDEFDITTHPLLDFKLTYNVKTGEYEGQVAKLNCLTFILKPSGRLFLQGSIHKMLNRLRGVYGPNQQTKQQRNKGFNGNKFTLNDLNEVVRYFRDTLYIDTESSVVRNLEVGVNLIHTRSTDEILRGVLVHKGEAYNREKRTYLRANHQEYYLKCYNKALQYGMLGNVLRFEMGYKRMRTLNQIGVGSLNSLQDRDLLIRLSELLVKHWNDSLFYDHSLRLKGLKPKEQLKLLRLADQNFWLNTSSNRHHKPKVYLTDLSNRYSDRVKDLVRGWIQDEVLDLMK